VAYFYPGAEIPSVKDVTLSGAENSLVALIGASGAGKSTIADLLLGVATPKAGGITIGGMNPAEIIRRFPGSLGYVPQRPGLIHGSIAENVALGVEPRAIDKERVREVIHLSQLADVVGALPGGIEADLGKHADSLSGGQLQRIGLARALYSRPRLVVLDEATSALDAETESEIVKAIAGLRHECTFIVIAHRLSTVQKADIVYVLEGGALIAQGTFSEVRKAVPKIESSVQLMSFPSESTED
jgi:ATP-binding cassette subfamily C protein